MGAGNEVQTNPLIGETAQYKSLTVLINGMELRSQDIVDVQINYGELIKAKISFADTMNMCEFAPITFPIIKIRLVDALNNETELDFIVASSEVLRIKNNIINVIMNLEELTSNALSTMYLSKTYTNMTFLEIVKDIANDNNLTINIFEKDGIKNDFFVVPGNISLWEWIKREAKLQNVQVFSDRQGLTLANKDLLNYNQLVGPSEHPFTLNRNEELPYWNIIEYQGKTSNNKSTQKAPKANLVNHDPLNLGYFPSKISVETEFKTQKLNKYMGYGDELEMPKLFENLGTREISHLEKNKTTGLNEDYRDIINNQQNLKIAVEGLCLLRVYSKIRIDLPRSVAVQSKQGDEVFGGLYVITQVIDKIVSGNFLQYLTLQAADYGPGPDDLQ